MVGRLVLCGIIGFIGVIISQMVASSRVELEVAYGLTGLLVLVVFAVSSELRPRTAPLETPFPVRAYCIVFGALGAIALIAGIAFSARLFLTHPIDASIGLVPVLVLFTSLWALWRMRWWGPALIVFMSALILIWQMREGLVEPLAQTLTFYAFIAGLPVVLGVAYWRRMS